jgi:hypothetical protein
MIGFIGTPLRLKSIITAQSQWLPKTRSVPYWATRVLPSTVMNNERRIAPELFLGSPFYWDGLERRLSAECSADLRMNSVLYFPGLPNMDHHLEQLVVILSVAKEIFVKSSLTWERVLVSHCLSNGLSLLFVTISSFRRCLLNRCLAMIMFVTVFWDITPCGPMKVNRCFGVQYFLLLQDRRISRAIDQR